ncbi:MAG: HD domain-containing protein [Gemmatimonadota bacterium]
MEPEAKATDELMPLGAPFMDALRMAAEIHQSQVRKGTDIPYIGHLMAVCALVIQAGGDENEVIAALLHDALEDTGLSPREIRERYGERVLEIVQGCSDGLPEGVSGSEERDTPDRGPHNWFERKARYHKHLRTADPSVLKVSCADKIDNARAIAIDLHRLGEALWERFNAGRDAQLWNYRTLAGIFAERREEMGPEATWLADELARQVEELDTPTPDGPFTSP